MIIKGHFQYFSIKYYVVGTLIANTGIDLDSNKSVIIPPAYKVNRGYIVFAFSVYMFVCVCLLTFFLSKISRKLLYLGF